jgi:hypothetical protein
MVLLVTVVPRVEAGSPNEISALAAWIDARSGLVLRLDFSQLEAVSQRMQRGKRGLALIALTRAAALTALSFDPLEVTGWHAAGIRGELLLAEVETIDAPAADRAYETLAPIPHGKAQALRTSPIPLWRTRVVFFGDPTSIGETWRKSSLIRSVTPIDRAHATQIGELLGAEKHELQRVTMELAHAGVFLAGRLASSSPRYLFARKVGSLIVIDAVHRFGGLDLVWSRDQQALRTSLLPPSQRTALATRLAESAPERLTQPGISVLIDAMGIDSALRISAKEQRIRHADEAQRDGGMKPTLNPPGDAECRIFAEVAESGPIRSASLGMRVDGQVVVDVRFATRGTALEQALPLADQGISTITNAGPVFAGVLYLETTDRLRALTLPGLLSSWEQFHQALRHCGVRGQVSLGLFAWPLFGTLLIDELAALAPQAAELVAAGGNFSFAVRRFDEEFLRCEGGAEISIRAGARSTADRLLEAVFGPAQIEDAQFKGDDSASSTNAQGKTNSTARAPVKRFAYGSGPLRAFSFAAAHRARVVGVLGKRAKAWYFGLESPPPTVSAGPPPLAAFRFRGFEALVWISERVGAPSVFSELFGQLRSGNGVILFGDHRLEARVSAEFAR